MITSNLHRAIYTSVNPICISYLGFSSFHFFIRHLSSRHRSHHSIFRQSYNSNGLSLILSINIIINTNEDDFSIWNHHFNTILSFFVVSFLNHWFSSRKFSNSVSLVYFSLIYHTYFLVFLQTFALNCMRCTIQWCPCPFKSFDLSFPLLYSSSANIGFWHTKNTLKYSLCCIERGFWAYFVLIPVSFF